MINISNNDFYTGKKSDDPDSPAYVLSIFGKKPDARMLQNERRYLAIQWRRQQKQESQEEAQMEGNVVQESLLIPVFCTSLLQISDVCTFRLILPVHILNV